MKRKTIYRFELQDFFLHMEWIIDHNMIEVSGNCELDELEMNKLLKAFHGSFDGKSIGGRFIFRFPDLTNDFPVRLAESLKDFIYKAAFILHPSVRVSLPETLFWEWCDHQPPHIAYLHALHSVLEMEVPLITEEESISENQQELNFSSTEVLTAEDVF